MSQDARLDVEQATMRRARILGMGFVDTSQIADKALYHDILTIPELKSLRAVPLQVDKNHILFGITTTTSQNSMQQLKQRFLDQKISFSIISENGFNDYMNLYDPPPKVEYQDISIASDATDVDRIGAISATLSQVRADDILAYLVKQAHRLNASDIHLETGQNATRIRFRVDGVLHPIAELSQDKYRQLLSSIAIAGNVATNSTAAQTGHINTTYQMADGDSIRLNLRLETIPTVYGMDVVMRLFNFNSDFLNLDNLGLSPAHRQVIDEIIKHPSGLVLIVGPTGSGKTTTLYSILHTLNNPERKIITMEEPVEYFIDGITQIPVDSRSDTENSFSDRFKAVLRLDPDVIMVGEIRDIDTAKTALQAALTGHLVLSTFHAGSASAALSRMMDAIGNNPLFVSAIKLVAAQRLVRRLDDATKQAYQPDDALRQAITKVVESLPEGVERPSLDNITLYHAGTSDQNPFGFSGQFALREQLLMTPNIQAQLRRPAREVSSEMLEQSAIDDGMVTMLQDGVLRALKGDTTIEEVYRVVG